MIVVLVDECDRLKNHVGKNELLRRMCKNWFRIGHMSSEENFTPLVEYPKFCFVDSHCHIQLDPLYEKLECIIEKTKRCGCVQIVVCGVSCGLDWYRVESIHSRYPGLISPQFGVHPWYIDDDIVSGCWEASLRDILTRLPNAGVGETGLDKNIKNRISPEIQENVLLRHMALAREFDRPITIHCVGYWGRLLALLKREEKIHVEANTSSVSIVIHSCNNMPMEIARDLLSLESSYVYFSFNGRRPLLAKQVNMARIVPRDRLLIESDSPDQKPMWEGCEALIDGQQVHSAAAWESDGASSPQNKSNVQAEIFADCNKPCYATSACHILSNALDVAPSDVAIMTLTNSRRVFRIVDIDV